MEKIVTAILGGGQGSRLWPLTRDRAKPAVPVGGKFRLIGMSISRNFPPTGTAGFARSRVRGQRRDPCPPPRMAVTIFSMIPLPQARGILSQETHGDRGR